MITRVYIENSQIGHPLEINLPARPLCAVFGASGTGKTIFWQSLLRVQLIARGVSSVGQVFPSIPYGMPTGNDVRPLRIVVDFLTRGRNMRYQLSVRFNPASGGCLIDHEALFCLDSNEVVFERMGSTACLGAMQMSARRYPIAETVFALATFVTPSGDHPVQIARAFLAAMFLVAPDSNRVLDDVRDVREYLNPDCSNFCSWMASFLMAYPSAYQQIQTAVQKALPSFEYLAVRDRGAYGRKMFVKNRSGGGEFPFSNLSAREKVLIVMSTIRVACALSDDTETCVWDDAFVGMSHKMIGQIIWDARQGLGRGQFVLLTADDSFSDKLAPNETIGMS